MADRAAKMKAWMPIDDDHLEEVEDDPDRDDDHREHDALKDEHQAEEREDQDVAREHVREEPDADSEISRMNWPRISSGTISTSSAFGASGIQLLK